MSRLLEVAVILAFFVEQTSGLPSGQRRSPLEGQVSSVAAAARAATPVASIAAVQAASKPTERPTQAIIAMPELQIQRFGHKCEVCEDDDGKEVGVVGAAAPAPELFSAPDASPERTSSDASETPEVPLQPASDGVFLQLESTEVKESTESKEVNASGGEQSGSVEANSTSDPQPSPSIGEVRQPEMLPARSFGEVRPQVSTEMVVIRREEANLGKDTVALQQQEGNSSISSAPVASPMLGANSSSGSEGTLPNTTARSAPPAAAASSALHVTEISDATKDKAVPVLVPLPESSAVAVVVDTLANKAAGASGPKLDRVHAEQRRTWSTIFLLLGLLGAALLGASCLAMGLWASTAWWSWRGRSSIRTSAESMTTWSAAKVEKKLPRSGGYDCTFSRPVSSGQLLRLEARVEGPSTGVPALVAPLTGQACVLYSAAVSQHVHDGIPPIPVAFSAASVDFMVSLAGAPHVRVELLGEEVSLFDMCGGRLVEKRSLAQAPERWQDFVLTHRTAAPGYEWQANPMVRADNSALEFQECALLVGSVITLIGELHRGADGALTLRPLQGSDRAGKSRRGSAKRECWRTSWELGGCEATDAAPQRQGHYDLAASTEAPSDKVLASDDPQLIGNGDASAVREGCGLAGALQPGSRAGVPAFADSLWNSLPLGSLFASLLRGRGQASRK